MSLEAVVSFILKFAKFNPFQARNAYSALLLIPGWESLRFAASIKQAKRLWENSGEKYADFWDAESVVEKLRKYPVNWTSVQ